MLTLRVRPQLLLWVGEGSSESRINWWSLQISGRRLELGDIDIDAGVHGAQQCDLLLPEPSARKFERARGGRRDHRVESTGIRMVDGGEAEGAARLPADSAVRLNQMRDAANLKDRRRKRQPWRWAGCG